MKENCYFVSGCNLNPPCWEIQGRGFPVWALPPPGPSLAPHKWLHPRDSAQLKYLTIYNAVSVFPLALVKDLQLPRTRREVAVRLDYSIIWEAAGSAYPPIN